MYQVDLDKPIEVNVNGVWKDGTILRKVDKFDWRIWVPGFTWITFTPHTTTNVRNKDVQT